MIIINSSFIVIWIVLFLCIIIPAIRGNKLYLGIIGRKKRGENRMLPKELIKEFVGKVCEITLFNASFGVCGRIEAVEDNWLKVDEKGKIRLINGDMIMNIKIMPDKYQKR